MGENTPTAIQEAKDTNTYSYKSLTSTNNIRLLQVQATAENGRIEAQLVETDLETAKERGYEALSYAWGKLLFNRGLYIDSYYLPITAHLHAALSCLTRDESRILWIDAICINQRDSDEKAAQIPLMHRIYYHAERVVAWLGEEEELIRNAFNTIPLLDTEMEKVGDNKKISRLEQDAIASEILTSHNRTAMLSHLFEREWFHRLWVVQEVVAASTILFVCGSCKLDFHILQSFVWLVGSLSVDLLSPRAESGFIKFQGITIIRSRRYKEHLVEDDGQQQMIELLDRTVDLQCSDPRDRLFALGEIATDPNALPYPADYHKDTATVYTDFAVHHITMSGQLMVLAYSRLGRAKINDMASWVPDWSAARTPAFHRLGVLDILWS
jgi:Heterokaryon incompatibility protein (HET)